MKVIKFITIMSLLVIFPSLAMASVIIDTGHNGGIGWLLSSSQWLSSEFSVDEELRITNIDGYLHGYSDQQLTISLYSDGGEIPGKQLFSTKIATDSYTGWQGASGLQWDVSSGTYWISFEVRPGDNYAGSLFNTYLRPLENEAFYSRSYGWVDGVYGLSYHWSEADHLNLALRISAEPSPTPVPLPPSIVLLAFGLSGIVFMHSNKIFNKLLITRE
jgi:hypothetical protein